MKTQQDLINDLDALGSTPTEVAENLLQLGCTGRKNSSCSCPVANYLKLKGYSHPSVFDETDPTIYIDLEKYPLCLTAPVATFIRAFDRGLYPDLEEDYTTTLKKTIPRP
jgi:hypothetical protein